MTEKLTPTQVREHLGYDPETGVFVWRKSRWRMWIGRQAGYLRPDGYVVIRINRSNYLAHRLAWAYINGEWPIEIDHEDTDPSNNRLSNLRPATRSQNKGNVRANANNTSGFKGVSIHKGRCLARIKHQYKMYNLGSFDTPEQAHAAYVTAAQKFFGDFARAA